ncbi:hypothetical protein M0R72_10160 [Candidatus Pacearchaeota archaeon]|jgi:hypothetical protein|nr:hypothetical protein [Candidatus Pacearchaeota archaeon]
MARQKQKTIPGMVDEVSGEVQDAADAYLEAKRSVGKFLEQMNGNLDVLISKMKEADVTEILIDDGDKRLTLTEKDQVKIVKRKKAGDDSADDD